MLLPRVTIHVLHIRRQKKLVNAFIQDGFLDIAAKWMYPNVVSKCDSSGSQVESYAAEMRHVLLLQLRYIFPMMNGSHFKYVKSSKIGRSIMKLLLSDSETVLNKRLERQLVNFLSTILVERTKNLAAPPPRQKRPSLGARECGGNSNKLRRKEFGLGEVKTCVLSEQMKAFGCPREETISLPSTFRSSCDSGSAARLSHVLQSYMGITSQSKAEKPNPPSQPPMTSHHEADHSRRDTLNENEIMQKAKAYIAGKVGSYLQDKRIHVKYGKAVFKRIARNCTKKYFNDIRPKLKRAVENFNKYGPDYTDSFKFQALVDVPYLHLITAESIESLRI